MTAEGNVPQRPPPNAFLHHLLLLAGKHVQGGIYFKLLPGRGKSSEDRVLTIGINTMFQSVVKIKSAKDGPSLRLLLRLIHSAIHG